MQHWGGGKEGTFKCKPSVPPNSGIGSSFWGLCTPSEYSKYGPVQGCTYSIEH